MKKVLVFGATGMAGHMIVKYLKQQRHEVTTISRSGADYNFNIEAMMPVQDFFNHCGQFDFIINCAGLLVEESNSSPARAAIVNSWFPHYVESRIANSATRLIHLSTDCVFNGLLDAPYYEDEPHTELNYYGRSKSLGEINNNKDITFRMSIIGPDIDSAGTGLFNFIYTHPNKELHGWTNAIWNGITTLELARCIDMYMDNPCIAGIYHLVNPDYPSISKYELLSHINKIFKLKKKILKELGPKYVDKTLGNTRIHDFDFEIADIETQLKDLREFMK